VRGDCFAVMYQ